MKRFLMSILRDVNLVVWKLKGSPTPPPGQYKRRELQRLGKEHGLDTFIETGTLHGETIATLKPHFKKLYSIELNPNFHKAALERFANDAHVDIIFGDSGVELPKLADQLEQPALFWLDAHWSGGQTAKGLSNTPIVKEISHLLSSEKRHIIVIDDVREFGTDPDYPTLEEFTARVKEMAPNHSIAVHNDLMRIIPPAP